MAVRLSRRTALIAGAGILATACGAGASITGTTGRSPSPANPVELAYMNFPVVLQNGFTGHDLGKRT